MIIDLISFQIFEETINNFSLKICISQKLFDNLFSSLAWSFIRKVRIYCKNVDLVELS